MPGVRLARVVRSSMESPFSLFIEIGFVSRQCLPSGLWENITFKECIHPTVLAFMSKNSNGRTKGGDEVR